MQRHALLSSWNDVQGSVQGGLFSFRRELTKSPASVRSRQLAGQGGGRRLIVWLTLADTEQKVPLVLAAKWPG